MSLAFLSADPAGGAVARSAMERVAAAAGARFAIREGWNVAVAFEGEDASAGGFADVSHLPKHELHGPLAPGLALGTATRREGAWWCPLTAERTLVIGADPGLADAVDVTSCYGALTICGPAAREIFSRFTAIDVRESSLPVGGLRPGSIARTPGLALREAEDRFLMLFGWALGEYIWTVVADAAAGAGVGALGTDGLGDLDA